MNKDTCVIIPVYNEASVLAGTLAEVTKHFSQVVCVMDGGSDDSPAIARQFPVQVVTHAINLGQGGALQTGIDWALAQTDAEYFITFDSDGQHRADDALRLLEELRKGGDIVMGSRFLQGGSKPGGLRGLVLRAAVLFSNVTSGVRLTDTHNGLRAFNRRVAQKLQLTMTDMSHASEILSRIHQYGFAYRELPVTVRYSAYTMGKGQKNLNAVNIVFDLLLNYLRGGK
jgi:polyprenyl-phospho-N-acetylgalactosaminyl synthase